MAVGPSAWSAGGSELLLLRGLPLLLHRQHPHHWGRIAAEDPVARLAVVRDEVEDVLRRLALRLMEPPKEAFGGGPVDLGKLEQGGSTWPSWTGTDQKRNFSLAGDELKWSLPASVGGTAEVVLKRTK
jgi:hypothetical protein